MRALSTPTLTQKETTFVRCGERLQNAPLRLCTAAPSRIAKRRLSGLSKRVESFIERKAVLVAVVLYFKTKSHVVRCAMYVRVSAAGVGRLSSSRRSLHRMPNPSRSAGLDHGLAVVCHLVIFQGGHSTAE